VGSQDAHVVAASARRLRVVVPPSADGGTAHIQIDGLTTDAAVSVEVARVLTTGVHQVDSPAFDGLGRLYVTQSGGPGTKVTVPLYRVARDGVREPVAVDIANPTSLVLGPDGAMYVSSRFERTVYRLSTDDRIEPYATELGVPTGLAFSRDGSLFVGDRSGSILRVSPQREVDTFATLPASVAAFHLAFGPDGALYVTAPTLSSRIDLSHRTRPAGRRRRGRIWQASGLAFDSRSDLYRRRTRGFAGLYRVALSVESHPELVWPLPGSSAPFDRTGMVWPPAAIWHLSMDLRPRIDFVRPQVCSRSSRSRDPVRLKPAIAQQCWARAPHHARDRAVIGAGIFVDWHGGRRRDLLDGEVLH
jgi:hypothetical protein